MTRPVLRFAPSPNGWLHLGHAYSALLNEAVARRLGGRLLLRIEDIDPVRSRPDFEAGIRDDLRWLDIAFEEPVRRQSEHLGLYGEAADRLRAGGLLYPCTCSRGDIARAVAARVEASGSAWPLDPDGVPLYPGTCRHRPPEARRAIEAGRPHAWRLDTARALATVTGRPRWSFFTLDVSFAPGSPEVVVEARPERWGDPVIVRKDVATSYHLSVVTDDFAQGVTHVVRGRDLEAAADIHALLQALLGLAAPRYHHHDLVRDAAGLKLSKSTGSPALASLRREGATPAAIRAALGF